LPEQTAPKTHRDEGQDPSRVLWKEQKWRNLQSTNDFAYWAKGGYAMQKATTVDGCVIAFRQDIKNLLRARVREAIEMVLEEELDEALGCGRYERGGTRFG